MNDYQYLFLVFLIILGQMEHREPKDDWGIWRLIYEFIKSAVGMIFVLCSGVLGMHVLIELAIRMLK